MTRLVRPVRCFHLSPNLTLYTEPVVLVGALEGSFLASFLLGWGVTTGAGLASYPLDTIRRRMMMTSGEAVKYNSSLHAFNVIVQKEGVKSLFKKPIGAKFLDGMVDPHPLQIGRASLGKECRSRWSPYH